LAISAAYFQRDFQGVLVAGLHKSKSSERNQSKAGLSVM
jgi:hypothetical protein